MRTTVLALALAALAATARADDKDAATVRVAGDLSGLSEKTINGKTTSSATLTTAAGVAIEVRSTSPLSATFFKSTKAKVALIQEQLTATRKLLADEKLKGKARTAALDKLKAQFKARERSMVVAEGTLGVADKKLRLTGAARLTDFKKADKDLPVGGAVVEGEAQAGKFAYGKDKEATLAIKNGAAPIVITGKGADEERKGKLRVYGVLKQGDKGVLVLEATKIEEVK